MPINANGRPAKVNPCNYNCLTAGGYKRACTCTDCNGKLHGAWRGIANNITPSRVDPMISGPRDVVYIHFSPGTKIV